MLTSVRESKLHTDPVAAKKIESHPFQFVAKLLPLDERPVESGAIESGAIEGSAIESGAVLGKSVKNLTRIRVQYDFTDVLRRWQRIFDKGFWGN